MSILYERVGGTLIFSQNTRLKTHQGWLEFNQVVIGNASKNLAQGATHVLLNGKKIFVKTTNQLNARTTIVRESWRSPIQGLRNGVFKFTILNDKVTRVTGIIDRKQIRPFQLVCTNQGCKAPDKIYFKDGTLARLIVNPKLSRAMQLLVSKAQREVHAFLRKPNIQGFCIDDCFNLCTTTNQLCLGHCIFLGFQCEMNCFDQYAKCLGNCKNRCN